MKGKVMLSTNDHPAIREAFVGFNMLELDIKYTLQRGGDSKDSSDMITTIGIPKILVACSMEFDLPTAVNLIAITWPQCLS